MSFAIRSFINFVKSFLKHCSIIDPVLMGKCINDYDYYKILASSRIYFNVFDEPIGVDCGHMS